MTDFRLRVTAETQDAERKLRAVDKTANEATKERKIKVTATGVEGINQRFKDINTSIKEAGNNIQTFYRFSKNIPGIGERVREVEALAKGTANLAKHAPESAAALRENAKAGTILSNSFETAGGAASRLVNSLAKTGFAIFAIKEAVGVLQAAFGGFFNETIGREIKLRETILKTQTTLASTNKVFRNGKEITDPYEKIVALTGEVNKRIDSIRERSIALAGVTSNDVIEVFGIVASQVSQIGGGLKDAEDLAISFSAALGTFGLPLEQARQEIGSILRGDVGPDSILAKSLGIDNPSLAKAKTEAGGVIKFVQERLAASVAGQKIAAQGFAGVLSNIQDLGELISQRFGAGLLDPLLGGLTRVFDFLFKIREEVFAISTALGQGLGRLLSTNLTAITGGSALFGQIGSGAEGFAASLSESVKRAFASLQSDANGVIAPLRNIFEEITKTVGTLAQGLAKLAEGFISIKIENFKALVQIFSNLSEAVTVFASGLSQVLKAYGSLLQVPFVQYLSQVSAQFQILERLGVMSAVKLGFAAVGLITAWKPIVAFFQALVARIAALIGGLVIAVGAAITKLGTLIASFASTLTATYPAVEAFKQQLLGVSVALTTAGASAERAGVSVARFGGATTAAARTVSTAILGFIKFNLILLAVQLVVTAVIDLFGRLQQAQDKSARSKEFEKALEDLRTKYKGVDEASSSAARSARDYAQALVEQQYAANQSDINKLTSEIEKLQGELDAPGIQSFGEALRYVFVNPITLVKVLTKKLGSFFGLIKDGISPVNGLASGIGTFHRALSQLPEAADKFLSKTLPGFVVLKQLVSSIADKFGSFINDLKELTENNIKKLGKLAPTSLLGDAFNARASLMDEVAREELRKKQAERSGLQNQNSQLDTERDKNDIESNIRLQAEKRTNLEKEIGDLRKQQEDQLFQLRQQRAQKEVEIFRAAGELRIFQMEQANKKMIEGEEGASAAALEALNNYLSTRERGELDIEVAKKDLAIELTNLEKQISDYRLENEKKIAEIRKRAGEYEKDVSNYRRQVEGQIAAGSGGGAATFGSTGNVKNAPGWVHGHFQTNTGSLNDLISDVIPVLKALLDQGIPVELSRGNKVLGGKDDAYYRKMLGEAARQHGHSGDGRSIDLFVPEGTKVPVPLSGITGNTGRGGITGTLPGTGKSWVGHLAPGSKGGGGVSIPPPKAPSFADVGAPAVEKYTASVQALGNAMGRVRALQAALTEAHTAAAFEEIAKAAFPKVQVEEYQDKVSETKLVLDGLAKVTAETYDPERLQLAAEYQTELNAKQREIGQIWAKALEQQAKGKLSTQELTRLQEDLNRRSQVYTTDLAKQTVLKQQQLNLDRLRQSLADSLGRTKSLSEGTQDLKTRSRLELEGVQQELIDAELKKQDLQRKLNEALKNANGDPALEFQARSTFGAESAAVDAETQARIAANDPINKVMGQWRRELKDIRAQIASLGQTIQTELGSAMSGAVMGVITGTTTIGEAFSRMFENIGKAFIDMATQMLAKAILLQVLGIFSGGSGGGSSSGFGGGLANSFTGDFGGLTSGISIFGGFKAAGGPVSGGIPYIVGERGPELFVPGSSGQIVSNQRTEALMASRNALNGNTSAATAAGAFDANRDAINSVSSLQRERQIERVLTSGAGSTEIKYSRVGSGDLPFVTETDMLQAARIAAQEGARMGQQRTLAALKNNPASRRTIGI